MIVTRLRRTYTVVFFYFGFIRLESYQEPDWLLWVLINELGFVKHSRLIDLISFVVSTRFPGVVTALLTAHHDRLTSADPPRLVWERAHSHATQH